MGNKLDKTSYGVLLAIIGLLVVGVLYFLTEIDVYDTATNESIFWQLALYAGAGIFGWITSSKYERNQTSAVLIWLIPILLHIAIYYWKDDIKVWVLAGGAFIVYSLGIMRVCKMLGKTLNDNNHYLMWRKRSRYIMIRVILCLVLAGLVTTGYFSRDGKLAVVLKKYVDMEVPDYYEWIRHDEKNLLSNNMEDICLFNGWMDLNDEMKKTALIALLKVECRYLGMETIPRVRVMEMEGSVSGFYDAGNDCVNMESSIFYSESGYSVINIVCRLVYERYELWQQRLYQKLYNDPSYSEYKNLLYFSDIVKKMEDDKKENVAEDQEPYSYGDSSEANYRNYIRKYIENGSI